jgi:hypothetical protein
MATTKSSMKDLGLNIAVLDRGWVFVGRVKSDTEHIVIEKGACVRFWGTSKGLGELASGGPLSATKLDPVDAVKFSPRALLFLLPCDEAKWKGY